MSSATMPHNDTWFEHLYVHNYRKVWAYVARRAHTAADDVTSETFTTAWKRRHDIPEEPLPWLYATARNHLAHHHRSDQRRAALTTKITALFRTETPSHDTAVDEHTTYAPVIATLFHAIGEHDTEILRLWAWEELDGPGLATALGISHNAARSRLHRAKRRAATHLAQHGHTIDLLTEGTA